MLRRIFNKLFHKYKEGDEVIITSKEPILDFVPLVYKKSPLIKRCKRGVITKIDNGIYEIYLGGTQYVYVVNRWYLRFLRNLK